MGNGPLHRTARALQHPGQWRNPTTTGRTISRPGTFQVRLLDVHSGSKPMALPEIVPVPKDAGLLNAQELLPDTKSLQTEVQALALHSPVEMLQLHRLSQFFAQDSYEQQPRQSGQQQSTQEEQEQSPKARPDPPLAFRTSPGHWAPSRGIRLP